MLCWQELDLKTAQFRTLLAPRAPLAEEPNINCLWARLAIDELCRLGVNTFCIAPGACSATLALFSQLPLLN